MKKGNWIYINGGKYKGKKIFLPNSNTTRPSKSIVRNSIFDTLQNEIYNTTFIELFAGSGSVGFEAISRGSSELYLLEIDEVAIRTLYKNRKLFPNEKIEIIEGDSFKNIETLLSKLSNRTILYIDPPFSIRQGMENIYSRIYGVIEKVSDHPNIQQVILEHISKEKPPHQIGKFQLYKSRKFGKTTISYYIQDTI